MQQTTLQPRSNQRSIGENSAEQCKKTQEHRKSSKKITTSPETTAFPRTTKQAKELELPPNRLRVSSSKPYSTDRKAKRTVQNANSPNETPRNCERRLHQHTTAQKTSKLPRTHAVDGSTFYISCCFSFVTPSACEKVYGTHYSCTVPYPGVD